MRFLAWRPSRIIGVGDHTGAAEFSLVNVALVTLLAWGALIFVFGGFTHFDALRAGRDSAFTMRLATYCVGFAPWLFLGPAVFLATRRYSRTLSSRRAEAAFAALLFFAVFGVIFIYMVTAYAAVMKMTAGQAVASTRLIEWVPDIFNFLIVYAAARGSNSIAETLPPHTKSRIAVRSQGRVDYVGVDDIVGGSACGNYVEIFTAARTYLYRGSIKSLCDELAPHGVIRVHRSHFVRPECVVSAKMSGASIRELVLTNGSVAPVSAGFEPLVRASLSERVID